MATIFQVRPEEIPDRAAMEELPQWDSLRHLELMLALELEFGLSIPLDQMLELITLDAIDEYVQQQAAGT